MSDCDKHDSGCYDVANYGPCKACGLSQDQVLMQALAEVGERIEAQKREMVTLELTLDEEQEKHLNTHGDLMEARERIEALEQALRLYIDAVDELANQTGTTITIAKAGVSQLVAEVIADVGEAEKPC